MENKRYYKSLDIIRVVSCVAVFLYHLNILKGGFLAVCMFFVLTGYLSFTSSFNKEKFSIKDYYVSRLKKIYLPFLVVVFLTIFVISLYPSVINWLNLKPETTSTILGYNNYWQLNASLDYFARHVDSPFMHFWYIAILLQFELVFPLIFSGIKKFNEKFNKSIILILLIILSLAGTAYYVYSSYTDNIMFTYYSTFTRLFSILYGITLGYINSYYRKLIPNKISESKFSNIIFYFYLIISIALFFVADSSSTTVYIYMILSSLLTCRLIEYSVVNKNIELNVFDKVNKFLSSISYEIYLVQYPVIFLFQELEIDNKYLVLIFVITLVVAYIINFALNYKKSSFKLVLLKVALASVLGILSIFGFVNYLMAEDHTEELKELENQLSQNQELMEQRQREYAQRLKEEENKMNDELEDLDAKEANLKETITKLDIIGIGDSVMLGAINSLYSVFPNGYFDAKTSRTDYVANDILQDLKKRGMLGEPILFGLGTNGQCGSKCRVKINATCGNRKTFWVTTTNKKTAYINTQLKEEAKSNKNMYIIDWEKESAGHSEYFVSDRIHLTSKGKTAYSNFIYNEIYKVYLEELQNKKDEIIKSKEEKEKSKLYFYGNDILLNTFESLKEVFENSTFDVNNFTYETLYKDLERDINNELSNNFVLIFDSSFKLSESDYKKLIDLLDNKNVYVLFVNSRYDLKYKDVNVIDIDLKDYLSVDRIHLTNEGNELLTTKLKEYFEF